MQCREQLAARREQLAVQCREQLGVSRAEQCREQLGESRAVQCREQLGESSAELRAARREQSRAVQS